MSYLLLFIVLYTFGVHCSSMYPACSVLQLQNYPCCAVHRDCLLHLHTKCHTDITVYATCSTVISSLVLLSKYNSNDEVVEDEIGRACSTNW
jgi:hypothetical protein